MPVIHVLSPHVADLIAAGEVVERPASAVKELLENAVDAGARTVVLELRAGGRDYIRVTDDGVGMAPEDAGVCFLRHATSKLSDERGLEAIGTLGFRGEALAAISAVSRITLTTRRRGAAMGVRVEVEAGEIVSMEETGCPEGTTITVRDLFYNTPARQKFLGTDRSESAACVQSALRTALGRPDVSFRCLRDGQEEFFSPGDGTAKSAVYALLGRDAAAGLLPVETESDGVTVKGFVSAPGYCRGNRGAQYFFCNGRPIRSRALQAALEQAYKNTAMVGKFPGCVLYITLPNGLVDVNVHPTKAEVKFAKEKPVFDGVYYGTLAALGQKSAPQTMSNAPFAPEAKSAAPVSSPARPAPAAASAPRKDFFRTMDADTFRQTYSAAPARPSGASGVRDSAPYRAASPAAPKPVPSAPVSVPVRTYTPDIPSVSAPRSPVPAPEAPVSPAEPAAPLEKDIPAPETAAETVPEQTVLDEAFRAEPVRYIGETLNVYILLEQGNKLLLIDKHAAHERVNFDRMKANQEPLMCQALLAPLVAEFATEEYSALAANLDLLREFGFECEEFGGGSLILRAIPADIDSGDAIPALEELADKLVTAHTVDPAAARDALLHTMACKAAIKGGWKSDLSELRVLVDKVQSGEVQFCPHGRPVKAKLTKYELEKMFKRV